MPFHPPWWTSKIYRGEGHETARHPRDARRKHCRTRTRNIRPHESVCRIGAPLPAAVELDACFVVRDHFGQKLSYIYRGTDTDLITGGPTMIRLITVLLTLALLMATAARVMAVEPEGWCNCNPEAPACRSICPYHPPLTGQQGWGYRWHGNYWHHDYRHYRYRRHHNSHYS